MNFLKDNLLYIAIALVSGSALLVPVLLRRGAKVSTLQATQLINQGKTRLLDVRNADEFAAGHVQDAINIPLSELSTRVGEFDKFKKFTIIAICESGARSASAAAILSKAGFDPVMSLEGGMAAWRAQGLPTAK